jgi:hypothetical protein
LENQLTNAKATFDLLEATWPPGFVPDAHESFIESHKGYDLAGKLWKGKIKNLDEPTEPDVNGWSRYLAYAGNAAVIETYDSSNSVAEYRGKRFLPFDKNISVLLTLASRHFNKGRQLVLNELK